MFWISPPLLQPALLAAIELGKVGGSRSAAHPLSPFLTPSPVSARLERVDVHRVVDRPVRTHRALSGQELNVGQGALAGKSPGPQEFT